MYHEDGRSLGTFTNYDSLVDHVDQVYHYLQLLKFDFGIAASDGSRLIKQSYINYQDLYNKVERYDSEVPKSDIKRYYSYIQYQLMNLIEFVGDSDKDFLF
mgnify:CR=1 FL=1